MKKVIKIIFKGLLIGFVPVVLIGGFTAGLSWLVVFLSEKGVDMPLLATLMIGLVFSGMYICNELGELMEERKQQK